VPAWVTRLTPSGNDAPPGKRPRGDNDPVASMAPADRPVALDDSNQFALTFDQAQPLRLLVDVLQSVLHRVDIKVVKRAEFEGIEIQTIDPKLVCYIVARLSCKVTHAGRDACFCIDTATLNTCIKSVRPEYAIDLKSDVKSSDIFISAYDSFSNNYVTTFSLPTLVPDESPAEMANINYEYTVEIDLNTLRGIVNNTIALAGQEVRFRLEEPVEDTPYTYRVFSIITDGNARQTHKFHSVTEARGDGACIIRTEESTAELPSVGEMRVLYDECFTAKYIASFVKSMERQIITMRLKAKMPLLLYGVERPHQRGGLLPRRRSSVAGVPRDLRRGLAHAMRDGPAEQRADHARHGRVARRGARARHRGGRPVPRRAVRAAAPGARPPRAAVGRDAGRAARRGARRGARRAHLALQRADAGGRGDGAALPARGADAGPSAPPLRAASASLAPPPRRPSARPAPALRPLRAAPPRGQRQPRAPYAPPLRAASASLTPLRAAPPRGQRQPRTPPRRPSARPAPASRPSAPPLRAASASLAPLRAAPPRGQRQPCAPLRRPSARPAPASRPLCAAPPRGQRQPRAPSASPLRAASASLAPPLRSPSARPAPASRPSAHPPASLAPLRAAPDRLPPLRATASLGLAHPPRGRLACVGRAADASPAWACVACAWACVACAWACMRFFAFDSRWLRDGCAVALRWLRG